jgi:hypothetical protein
MIAPQSGVDVFEQVIMRPAQLLTEAILLLTGNG